MIPAMMWDRDRGWVARVWTQDHMASGPSKFQEIEPLEGDDNRQACETALTKVKCPHLDCGWELEAYPEVAHIWLQFHKDENHQACGTALEEDVEPVGVESAAEYGGTQMVELLEEDEDHQACETALERLVCRYQSCDWEEVSYPEVADIWIQDHVDTVHGGSQYIGPAEVDSAAENGETQVHDELQHIEPDAGRSKPQEIVLPEEDKNHQACGTALERDIKLAGTLT